MLAACTGGVVFEENQAIPKGVWKASKKLEFRVNIEDLNTAYDMFLNLRNGTEYPYSNLYIFMTTHYPIGRSELDTLQFLLADKAGKWYGTGLGDIKSSSVLFRYRLLFPMQGEYRFVLEQAMRKEELQGVWDVGLRVAKTSAPDE